MSVFIDAHCHPTLKHYLFDRDIFGPARGRPDFDYTNIQVTYPAMDSANVNAVLTAHYLPEKFIKDWKKVELIPPLFRPLVEKYLQKLENDDAFAQTLDMIDQFEKLFDTLHPDAVIAHTFQKMKEAIDKNQKVFIHTLEGGHHLGRDLSVDQYSDNIDILKQKGVAMITLLHWYPNNITTPTEGIPPKTKKKVGMDYAPVLPGNELTKTGEYIIKELLQKGILIDLTHTNPVARKQIYAINQQHGNKPLIFSHVGVRKFFNDEDNPRFALMAPDDDEIIEIKNCNGVIGVIFMNYWLTGQDDKRLNPRNFGFEFILNTIQHIANLTGSFDHIAIGTDFDGMADPPDDYFDCGMLGEFRNKLLQYFAEEDVNKITGGNLLRVLENTWGQA